MEKGNILIAFAFLCQNVNSFRIYNFQNWYFNSI